MCFSSQTLYVSSDHMEYSYDGSTHFSANSNICVSFGLVSIDWFFSFWVTLSFFFTCLIISDWILDIVNFGAGYFCTPINIPELSSPVLQRYLEMVWSFLVLLLRFLRQDQSCVWSGVSNPHYRPRTLLCTLSNNPMDYKVFQSGCWEEALNPMLCEPGELLPPLFGSLGSLLTWMCQWIIC